MKAGSPEIISFTSERGGLGRTTTLANVAYCLARRGFRTGVVDMSESNSSKLRRLLTGELATTLQILPNIAATDPNLDIILTDGAAQLDDECICFFHRIDLEGLEQANRAIDAYRGSRLILVPSLIPWAGDPKSYMVVENSLEDLEARNPLTIPIRLDYYLMIVEELYARSRPDHPLVTSYASLARMILNNKFR